MLVGLSHVLCFFLTRFLIFILPLLWIRMLLLFRLLLLRKFFLELLRLNFQLLNLISYFYDWTDFLKCFINMVDLGRVSVLHFLDDCRTLRVWLSRLLFKNLSDFSLNFIRESL